MTIEGRTQYHKVVQERIQGELWHTCGVCGKPYETEAEAEVCLASHLVVCPTCGRGW